MINPSKVLNIYKEGSKLDNRVEIWETGPERFLSSAGLLQRVSGWSDGNLPTRSMDSPPVALVDIDYLSDEYYFDRCIYGLDFIWFHKKKNVKEWHLKASKKKRKKYFENFQNKFMQETPTVPERTRV